MAKCATGRTRGRALAESLGAAATSRYNLGHHRIPSNKFLLYDHSLRIPMLVRGPAIRRGESTVLGTNVDFAPTFLGLAGAATAVAVSRRTLTPATALP